MKFFNLILISLSLLSTASYSQSIQQLPNEAEVEFNEIMQALRKSPTPGSSIKIQNLVDVVGEESVKLSGFGVVSGLNGTGDSSEGAIDLLLRVAKDQNIILTTDQIKKGNLAVVSISADVNPHEKTFDIAVKSVSDAKSLQNGFLEGSTLTPIGSNNVFGVASGAIALGARYFSAAGQNSPAQNVVGGTSNVTIGHPTMGFVLSGGELIKEIPTHRVKNGSITLFIKYPSSRTATNIANVINNYMNLIKVFAEPTNASTITINIPKKYQKNQGLLTRLIADIGDLSTSVERKAIITIDQGSGVIAMTEGVKMAAGSIAIAGLTVTVSSDITPVTRQDYFDGETSFMDTPELEVAQDNANFLTLPEGTDLKQVQETLNALKLTPTSVISVFTAMHKAGMIHAELVIIPR
jgi:flagellar P-ring protein FlgI